MTTLFKLLQPVRPIALLGEGLLADVARLERLRAGLTERELQACVVFETAQNTTTLDGCLIDVYGDFARLYGMTGDFLCIIRSEDHIGLFQQPLEERVLADYLSRISRPPARASASA